MPGKDDESSWFSQAFVSFKEESILPTLISGAVIRNKNKTRKLSL
jgi:hypothetical protein